VAKPKEDTSDAICSSCVIALAVIRRWQQHLPWSSIA
jgi:hypothetical protein